MPEDNRRLVHDLTAPLHTYAAPVSPKSLLESLNVADFALAELERIRPGYSAGGSIATHRRHLRHLAAECHRKRPTGPDGKHNDRHTPECGCSPHPGTEQDHAR